MTAAAPTKKAAPKTTEKTDVRDKDAYRMVKPRVGDMVIWYEDRSSTTGRPAFVTDVFDFACDLSVLVANAQNFMVRGGVRWKQDPNGNLIDEINEGCWEFPDVQASPTNGDGIEARLLASAQQSIAELQDEVVSLKLRVAKLESQKQG
jgi:hypothetical protein